MRSFCGALDLKHVSSSLTKPGLAGDGDCEGQQCWTQPDLSRATQRRAAVSPDMALSLQLLLCTWLHRVFSAFRLAICPLHKTERLSWSDSIWDFKAEINSARALKIRFLSLLNVILCTIDRTRCVLAGVEFISVNLESRGWLICINHSVTTYAILCELVP